MLQLAVPVMKKFSYYLHPVYRFLSFYLSGRNPLCRLSNEAADASGIKALIIMVQAAHRSQKTFNCPMKSSSKI